MLTAITWENLDVLDKTLVMDVKSHEDMSVGLNTRVVVVYGVTGAKPLQTNLFGFFKNSPLKLLAYTCRLMLKTRVASIK